MTVLGNTVEASQLPDQRTVPATAIPEDEMRTVPARTLPEDDKANRVLGWYSAETNKKLEHWLEEYTSISTFTDPIAARDRLVAANKVLLSVVLFDNIYYLIYGSQICLLQAANVGGATVESLKHYYDTAAQQFPYAYTNFTYEQYLAFFKTRELLVINEDGGVQITPIGRDFLVYLVEMSRSMSKPY